MTNRFLCDAIYGYVHLKILKINLSLQIYQAIK